MVRGRIIVNRRLHSQSRQWVLSKGMSRKKFCLDRRRDFFSRDPAHWSFASLEKLGRLPMLICFLRGWWRCHRVPKGGKPDCYSRSTMVLSEARGLWLFLVLRGGI